MLGVSNAGGVEKVSYYLEEILKEKYKVEILQKGKVSFGKLNNLIHPVLLSLRLCFKKNAFVIGNSWHCFLYPADISVHHGTSAGIMKCTGEGGMSLKLTAWMEKVSAKRAKHVLAVSENCKKELVELYGIAEEKIEVLNNFVQDEVFTPKANFADTLEEGKKVINVCFSGALCYKKGIDKLQTFSDYIEKWDNPEYVIKLNIATNYEKNAGAFLGNKNTRVRTGLTSAQMPDFYRKNDIMYFPTRYEGFSMAALEALSCGLPLIGSRFAVGPEFEDFEFCKLIRDDASMQDICCAIIDLYKGLGENTSPSQIHEAVRETFGTEQYKDKLFKLIDAKNM